jgi:hypothetical protein
VSLKGLRGLSTRLAHFSGGPCQRSSSPPPLLPSPATWPLSRLYAIPPIRIGEQWNDGPCDAAFPFICERDPAPTSNRGSFSYNAPDTNSTTQNTVNYSLHLYAGQVFTVGTCGVPGATAYGDTYLRIRNPSGSVIASNDDANGGVDCDNNRSNLSIVVPVTGSYTIHAGCWSSWACGGTVALTY